MTTVKWADERGLIRCLSSMRAVEQGFAPVARQLGWRPEFRWQRLAQWAVGHGGVRLVERKAMPPLGLFSLIRFERLGKPGANGQGR